MEYKRILTQDFITIKIPILSGKSEKQRAFGENIRQKYIDIFNRKLNNYDILMILEEKNLQKLLLLFKSSTNKY